MISPREAELLARRAVLRERIDQQRRQLEASIRPLAAVCDRVDQVRATAKRVVAAGQAVVERHPLWAVAALTALIAARPRRALHWGGRLLMLWRGWSQLRRLWQGAARP